MNQRKPVKYKFTLIGARKGRAVLQILVNNKYLDRKGDLKKVQRVVISPFNTQELKKFLQEPNLLSEHDDILKNYESDFYALLLAVESADGRTTFFTIEEFEFEFGIPPFVMEMVLDHKEGNN